MIILMCSMASMICIGLIKSRDDLDQSQSITHLWGNQMKNGEIGRRRKKLTEITDTASLQCRTLSTLKIVQLVCDYQNST